MELTPLRYFIAIATAGHMTRAARALGVTQPALSAALRKLEAEVGAELLHRTGRGVELTEAGRVFLAAAEDTVRRAEGAVRAVREVVGLERGSIRVGGGATATTYLLPRVVSAVRAAHPGLRFYVREAGSRAVATAVLAGELDLGIVTLPLEQAVARELVVVPLVEDELRLIVPAKHALAGKRQFKWQDLAGEGVVAFEAGTAVREMIDRASAAAGVSLNVVMELRSIESIKQMVAAGIGVGFVSRFGLREGEGLTCRDERLARRLAIVRRADRAASAAVAAFERAVRSAKAPR
ncbi:MAG TPA: LysR substrate-binding domain-containing protein [Phycisphaerales bacterium]|nr:LysR substrate-binding domain-containing protein [Phycisphaerales bacterium]